MIFKSFSLIKHILKQSRDWTSYYICSHLFSKTYVLVNINFWGWRRITCWIPPVKYFTDSSKAVLFFMDLVCVFCLVFVMPLCAPVYLCLVVTCWERADLLALVAYYCEFVTLLLGILGQVWYLIVSIPDLCTLLTLKYYDLGKTVCYKRLSFFL